MTTPADAGRPGVVDAGAPGCGESLISCGGQCVDLKTSNQNCGACGTLCNDGSSCSNSKCNPPVTVPNGCTAKMFEGKTYAFCTRARTWNDARRACINADMELALVTSGDESDFIKANGDSWIAANDLDKEGAWVSPVLGALNNNNGPVLTYTRWNAGEPSNSQRCGGVDIFVGCIGARTDEDCGLVLGASGNWNDADCNTERNYVCEPF